ncbi:E3 ubiquitin-protein ligase bre1, variant 3 [Batrachochytrium dendrobatidis]
MADNERKRPAPLSSPTSSHYTVHDALISNDSSHPNKKLNAAGSHSSFPAAIPGVLHNINLLAARHPILATASHSALSISTDSPDNDGLDPKSLEATILAFQKKAIWTQMEEYQRQLQRANDSLNALESRALSAESAISSVTSFVESIHQTLVTITQSPELLGPSLSDTSHSELATAASSLLFQLNLLSSTSPSKHPHSLLSTWSRSLTQQWLSISHLLNNICLIISKKGKLSPDIDSALSRIMSLTTETTRLQYQVAQQHGHIESLEAKFEATEALLRRTEKKLDRLKIQGVSGLANVVETGSNGTGDSSASTHTGILDGVANPNTINSNNLSSRETSAMISEEKYVEAMRLAELRLNEIQLLKKDRILLQNDLNTLRIELEDARSSQLRIADMDRQIRYEISQQEALRTELERILMENQTLNSDRRVFTEQVRTIEAKERKILESEYRKLELDLHRIRTGRDALQKTLDERIVKDDLEIKQHQELKVIADTRSNRIITLEAEVQRLKMRLAADSGERGLLEFFDENPQENPYLVLKDQITKLKAQREHFEKLAKSLQSNDALAELSARLSSVEEDRQALAEKLERYNTMYESIDLESKTLLEDQTKKLHDLSTKCEYYQKTESRLLTEIETIGKAWADLEGQNSKRVTNLAEKEDHIMRLLAEKAKYEQKFALLSKQSTTYNNMGIALRRQSDKQLEQIRKQEEIEKNMSMQLQVLEKEAAAKAPLLEKEKRKVADLMQQVSQYKERFDRASQRCDQLVTVVKQKTELVEHELDAKRRLQEQMDLLKKKLETVTNTQPQGDASLLKQLEEYKLLLKCQSCSNNFKSHVLLKCMHTFW